ncbi:alpha/beta hydrolase [Amycolatopsis jiangsuensis]|uniref:Pimeloyl-ACP methyl ester carboxylesterase n=1 Tax=Amycolatopsis jiangsuensis TaxID=1181879 RepID=A0A840IZR4_9PSEU|nr:alpha/beta hydrolase [Amycolatopsis jiangsuensis]MBB4688351.1 pimeloyl-ACP methyl ester carboxylesterase [Amycolatopsis jiangsuensis]
MRKTWVTAFAVAVVTAAALPAVAAASPETPAWGDCPADVAKPGLECGTLQVPLDYRNPGGTQIDLTISRVASTKPAARRGVLLTNPGGPGDGGLNFPALLRDNGLPQSVLDSYDVIGFDPRGVGHSTPVTCDLRPDQPQPITPPYAHNRAEVVEQADYSKTVAEQCAAAKTGPMLPYVTTANTARDMDRIRMALGEPKISYYGASYGTYLGSVYTTMFPERSDRIVLDSNMGPGGYDSTGIRLIARGMQDRFPDFAKFAAADPEKYQLGSTAAQVTAKFYELVDRLDRTPVQGFDGATLRLYTLFVLYTNDQFPTLAETWHALDTGRPPPAAGAAAAEAGDNNFASHFAVLCADSRWPKSIETYQRHVVLDRARYPMLGGATANVTPCAFWPTAPIEPPVRIGDRGPSNVLMVQNLRDPGTPVSGARQLRRAFGDRARMVTVDQGGHGVYVFAPNKCGNDAVTDYLATGKRPAHDRFCAAEPAPAPGSSASRQAALPLG